MAKITDLRVLRREAQYPRVITMIRDQKSRREIADEMKVTERTIADWIRTPEFKELWQESQVQLTDVWREAAIGAIQDMLPVAVRQHERMLENEAETVPASVLWHIVRDTYEMARLSTTAVDDRDELKRFLRDAQVNITQVNQEVHIDASDMTFGGATLGEALSALHAVLPDDVVEGELVGDENTQTE